MNDKGKRAAHMLSSFNFVLTGASGKGTNSTVRALRSVFLLFLLVLLPFYAGAQDKPVFGLQQLIRMAVDTNPEMAEIRSEISAARADLAQAEAGYYPQLDTMTIIGPVENARRPRVINGRITDPSAENAVGIFGRTDITLSQPLYTFGKLPNLKEAAQHGVKANELKLSQKQNEIVLRIKELYYALVIAGEGIEAAKGATEYFDEARSKMSRLLEIGASNVIESDLYRVDTYRAGVIRSSSEAEKGVKITYYALKSLCGIPADQEFEVADKTLTVAESTPSEAEDFVKRALADRPELRQLDVAIEARKRTVEAAKSDLYPSFFAAFHGSFAGAPGRQAFHNPYISDDFNHVEAGVVIGLTWHFDFGITRGRIAKERAGYEQLTHTKANARLNIPIEVIKYYHDAREWRTAIDAYQKAASASRKWVVAALTNFDMGTGTADDMLRGIERYGESQGKYLEALFNYNMALAQLDYATGGRNW